MFTRSQGQARLKPGDLSRKGSAGEQKSNRQEITERSLRQKHSRESEGVEMSWLIYCKVDWKSGNRCAGRWGRSGDREWQEKEIMRGRRERLELKWGNKNMRQDENVSLSWLVAGGW